MRIRSGLRFLPALFWMAVIYRFSATPGLRTVPLAQRMGLLPFDLSPALLNLLEWSLRKSAHLLSYGLLALLLLWGFRGLWPRWRAAGWALGIAVLYAVTDEWHQSLVPDRQGRWTDVLIDTIGAATALWLAGRRAAQTHGGTTYGSQGSAGTLEPERRD
ncbi:MAG: VanZ family protein [Bacillota bacterium]